MEESFERQCIATLITLVVEEIATIERMFGREVPGVLKVRQEELKKAREYLEGRIKKLNHAISEDVRA